MREPDSIQRHIDPHIQADLLLAFSIREPIGQHVFILHLSDSIDLGRQCDSGGEWIRLLRGLFDRSRNVSGVYCDVDPVKYPDTGESGESYDAEGFGFCSEKEIIH